MTSAILLRMLAAAALAGCLALPLCAQQSSSSQSSQNSSSSSQSSQENQKQSPPKKSTAQENPFPEEQSEKAAQQQSQPDAPATPDATGQSPASAGHGAAAQENPFPEQQSEKAADAARSGSSSSSSSSNSSSSSSSSSASGDPWDSPTGADPANPDGNVPGSGRRRLGKPTEGDIQSGSLTGQWKANEDIKVGRFYLGTGNYAGAHGRFAEATRLDPTNIEAIYGLAQAADGMHRKQEALTNYQLYLAIAPDGRDAKAARKALHSLSK